MSEFIDALADAAFEAYHKDGSVPSWDLVATAVIAAIGDSGRVVVDRARFERLLECAFAYYKVADTWNLQPGDLEPL